MPKTLTSYYDGKTSQMYQWTKRQTEWRLLLQRMKCLTMRLDASTLKPNEKVLSKSHTFVVSAHTLLSSNVSFVEVSFVPKETRICMSSPVYFWPSKLNFWLVKNVKRYFMLDVDLRMFVILIKVRWYRLSHWCFSTPVAFSGCTK